MHIVTGMLIAGLLRRRKSMSLLPRLRTGPVQTAHAMPGRVRFRVPSLVGQSSNADDFCAKLCSIQGVESVSVNQATGSVLVIYDEQQLRPELLFAATVRLLGLEQEMTRNPAPLLVKELRSLVGSLDRVVYDRTAGLLDFSSALMILLAGLGLRNLVAEGVRGLPGGFTLAWWGLHHLLGQKAE